MAMSIIVNGEGRELADGATVRDLARELDLPEDGVAVAVDGEVVPASTWDGHALSEGAEIDVLTAVQGG